MGQVSGFEQKKISSQETTHLVIANAFDIKPGLLTSRYGARRPKGSRVFIARIYLRNSRDGIAKKLGELLADGLNEQWDQLNEQKRLIDAVFGDLGR